MTKLFLDFDGVLNFDQSLNKYRKHLSTFGYAQKFDVFSPSVREKFAIKYSAELIRKLNVLHTEQEFEWLWLSTWVDETVSILDPLLGTESDGFIEWQAYGGLTYVKMTQQRAERKYEALKTHYDQEPFVWADDEATFMFNESDFAVPALVLAPDPLYGLVRDDLERMSEFFIEHKGW